MNLRVLFLESSEISDISPLAALSRLQWLSLAWNRISDIAPLARLTDLRSLDLDGNQIEEISVLAELHRIGEVEPLDLRHRPSERIQIRRTRPSSGFGGSDGIRAIFDLSGNQIRDISPLVENPSVRIRPDQSIAQHANRVILKGNPLNDEAYEVHIPALQERGVEVLFDPKP